MAPVEEYLHKTQFKTAGEPIDVQVNAHRSPSSLVGWNVSVAVDYPHPLIELPGHGSAYIAEEVKNPALLPAAQIIKDTIATELKRSLKARKLEGLAINPGTGFVNSTLGVTLGVDFKPQPVLSKMGLGMGKKDADGIVGDLALALDKARPKIEAAIAEHKHLEPDPDNIDHHIQADQHYERSAAHAKANLRGVTLFRRRDPLDRDDPSPPGKGVGLN